MDIPSNVPSVAPLEIGDRAPGKLILVGEHGAVRGCAALAMPFSMVEARAMVLRRPGPLAVESLAPNFATDVAGLESAAAATLAAIGQPTADLKIRVASTIPIGRGLGSSAAVAVALVRALFGAHGQVASPADVATLAAVAECHAHGNPSGVDVQAVMSDGPIIFRRGAEPQAVAVHGAFFLVVADSGRARDTHAAVAEVGARLAASSTFAQSSLASLESLTHAAAGALTAGNPDALGEALNAAQDVLVALGASDSGLDGLVSAARGAGALGAKLTGAGHGGCVIALAAGPAHADLLARALSMAGAITTWLCVLGPSGGPR